MNVDELLAYLKDLAEGCEESIEDLNPDATLPARMDECYFRGKLSAFNKIIRKIEREAKQ